MNDKFCSVLLLCAYLTFNVYCFISLAAFYILVLLLNLDAESKVLTFVNISGRSDVLIRKVMN